ncbi:MAG: DegT/DnrJ/EryC1/StrS family aminotransferase [Patescibacteria group bacterium]
MKNNFITFGKPEITQDDIKEIVKVLRSGWIGLGPKTEEFEKKFAEYQDIKYAVATNSCTAALHLALDAIGIKPGDEIITTPFTFAATANVITHMGAKPIFVDIDRDTLNINPNLIEKAISPKTKAIIPVHIAGRPCEMDKIKILAKKYRLFIIGDCAHAIESEYKNTKIGQWADISCYSFYPTKNITAIEGGMAITDNKKWHETMKIKRLHGISKDAWKRYGKAENNFYEVLYNGYKYNMNDVSAALGLNQLKRVEKNWQKRDFLWKKYIGFFRGAENIKIVSSEEKKGEKHAHHLFIVLLNIDNLRMSRAEIINYLKKNGIGSGIHFLALHLHPYYKNTYGCKKGDFPEAEYASQRILSLPLDVNLNIKDILKITKKIREINGKKYEKR